MSDLSEIERIRIEKLFDMDGGLVCDDFSNRTFRNFVLENVEIDIYEEKYSVNGASKANRLRAFWEQEHNHIVGKLLASLIEHRKTQESIGVLRIKNLSEKLFDECFKISQRLIGDEKNIDQSVAVSAHFEEIQQQIIDQIEVARFTIWVAVAWFTDKKLFDKLVVKKNQGINVQLIIIDDETNNNSRLNYEKEFETHRIAKFGKYENIMHNKFCIIDLDTVINGSYNWTNKAKYHDESITVIHGRENAKQFSEEFIRLKLTVIS